MLAKTYKPGDKVHGWFMSEKLDGRRCLWDGGVSRGRSTMLVPWSNTNKTGKVKPVATGLWTRYGNVVNAPEWFLDELPKNILLDGELYIGKGEMQTVASITSAHIPDEDRWKNIKFMIFDSPSIYDFSVEGKINHPSFERMIYAYKCKEYFETHGENVRNSSMTFDRAYEYLCGLELTDPLHVVEQTVLPYQSPQDALYVKLNEVVDSGGEGIMLRRPFSFWVPKRTNHLLKVKPLDDMEGTVVGYVAGLGKHYGALGSLIVDCDGIRLHVSGFTDIQRVVGDHRLTFEYYSGQQLPSNVDLISFPLGSVITFKYTGKTRDGVPREARFWRKYE